MGHIQYTWLGTLIPACAYCITSQKQTNYLIDEAKSIGRGANSIISYLHHYHKVYGVGKADVLLQADNCLGQNNNNNAMIQYLMWFGHRGKHTLMFHSFHDPWTYMVFSRPVSWSFQEEVSDKKNLICCSALKCY